MDNLKASPENLQLATALKQLLQLYLLQILEKNPDLRRSLGAYKININVTI